jgi:hypothetical protein
VKEILKLEWINPPVSVNYRLLPLGLAFLSPIVVFSLFPDIFSTAITPVAQGCLALALLCFVWNFGCWVSKVALKISTLPYTSPRFHYYNR